MSARPAHLPDLQGRSAVVTGAGGGIGRALAGALARAGANIVVADIDAGRAHAAAAGIAEETGVKAIGAGVDVSRPEQVDALAALARDQLGGVHVLCNNAGVQLPGKTWEFTASEWDWLLGVNLFGVINGIRSFVPAMIASGEPGHVVNTASVGGLVAYPGIAMYSAAKHAVVGLSETLAHDLAEVGAPIGVTVLCPGPTNSSLRENSARLRPGGEEGKPVPAVSHWERMPAEAVADLTVEAIRTNRFWLVTHAEYLDMVLARARGITETDELVAPPSLDEQAAARVSGRRV